MWLQSNSAPLFALGPTSQPLPHLWGGLADAVLRGLLAPGDPDAAVGRSQLDRPGEQHCVSGAIEGLRPDAQGGDGREAGRGSRSHPGFAAEDGGPRLTSAVGFRAPTTVDQSHSQGGSHS